MHSKPYLFRYCDRNRNSWLQRAGGPLVWPHHRGLQWHQWEDICNPHDRYLKHIDIGERTYSFRITSEKDIDKAAQIFNEKPQVMSFFPSGEGEKMESFVTIDNDKIILSSIRSKDEGYELTLYNTAQTEEKAVIDMPYLNKKLEITFGKMELKFIEV